MKYCFTTLSIGEEYEKKTIQFYTDLSLRTTNCDFFITTTNQNFPDLGDRFKIKVINFLKQMGKMHLQRGPAYHQSQPFL
jgi:hypothetical protein